MKIIVKYICVSIGVLSLYSCNKYLDQMPDNRTVIDSPEKVKELLVTAYPAASYICFCEAMSDNVGDKSKLAYLQELSNEEAYFWKDITSITQDTPDFYWGQSYAAIAAANHALEFIENVEDRENYKALEGEALVSRAYNHFMLVSIFSQRYDPNTADRELGIPYVLKPEKIVYGKYERKTVKYVYDMIKKDLEKGLLLINNNIYDVPKFHFTEAAAYGFASRFYLTIGDWEQAYKCANKVLGLNPGSYLRDWNAYTSMDYNELKTTYTKSSESANILLVGATSVAGRYLPAFRYGMTRDISNRMFRSDNVSRGMWLYQLYGNEVALNIPKFKEHFKRNSINASTGQPFIMAPLVTMEEVLFNRMEALVMLGELESAMVDINTFLSKRIKEYNVGINSVNVNYFEEFYRYNNPEINPWFGTTEVQRIFLKGILDLKRREFIQEGMRWFDIKRFNIEVKRKDESGEVFDILIKNDLRRAIQIPQATIAEGIKPNKR